MNRLLQLFPELTADGVDRMGRFLDLLQQRNRAINLISRRREDRILEDHLLPSLAIAKFCSFAPATRLIDVGTGGGFPGLPLAILLPHCHFHLIDSIGKKVVCVRDFVAELGLGNVTVERIRAEDLRGSFDFVLGRAVSALRDFHDHTKHLLRKDFRSSQPNGTVYLKGGDVTEDLVNFDHLTRIDLSDLLGLPVAGDKCLLYLPFDRPSAAGTAFHKNS